MAKVEFSLDVGNLEAKLKSAIPNAKEEAKKELYQFGTEVMYVSLQRVPVDTGALMSTGRVELPVEEGSEIVVTLGYGSMSVGYAWPVHEMMEGTGRTKGVGQAIHWTRPGSGPKYLENPLKEVQDQLPGRVKDAIVRGFKK